MSSFRGCMDTAGRFYRPNKSLGDEEPQWANPQKEQTGLGTQKQGHPQDFLRGRSPAGAGGLLIHYAWDHETQKIKPEVSHGAKG